MAAKKNYNSDGRSAEDRTLDKFAELLIEKLETIQADWKKPWFTEGVSTSLPKNLSGREYNGMNSMMLMLHAEKEGFKMPVWATFDRITGLNYVKDKQGVKHEAKDSEGNNLPLVSVNKGAKSFPVFITTFTVVDKETKEKIKYDDYRQMTEQDRERYNVYPKLSVYNVFNVEGQTNLKESSACRSSMPRASGRCSSASSLTLSCAGSSSIASITRRPTARTIISPSLCSPWSSSSSSR